ncbi:terminase small subunit [Alicyclobacillus kakegawensis]|uniref:terminase small subunit n=1 Tax=Alicyclobacillus kakegawensis TaxID=392012 RepID=UPI0008352EF8|nr:terminase small subunit [Alicyclobacillus kakegawensis]
MSRFSIRQQAFCEYYIETGNATEAYRRAGYKAEGDAAATNASRLLSNPRIQEYISERMKQKDQERIASQDEILEMLTCVIRGKLTEQVPVVFQDGFEMADKQPSLKDRIKAAELLGKRYMMWTDRQMVDANHTVTFIDDLED